METTAPDEYACVACGRCCYYNQPSYVLLYPEDIEVFRLAGIEGLTVKSALSGEACRAGEDGSEIYMRMENGHCCALDVTPGESYKCSIYPDHPLLCRMFEPGNPQCLEARARPTQEMPPDGGTPTP